MMLSPRSPTSVAFSIPGTRPRGSAHFNFNVREGDIARETGRTKDKDTTKPSHQHKSKHTNPHLTVNTGANSATTLSVASAGTPSGHISSSTSSTTPGASPVGSPHHHDSVLRISFSRSISASVSVSVNPPSCASTCVNSLQSPSAVSVGRTSVSVSLPSAYSLNRREVYTVHHNDEPTVPVCDSPTFTGFTSDSTRRDAAIASTASIAAILFNISH